MTNNNVLVINGRRYDALTGQLLGPSSQPAHRGRSIDGISVPKKSKLQPSEQLSNDEQPSVSSIRDNLHGRKIGHAHDVILSTAMHSSSTAKPLMRNGLKKPLKNEKSIKQLQTPIRPKETFTKIQPHNDETRTQRVKEIPRNGHVEHFSTQPTAAHHNWDVSSSSEPTTLPPTKIAGSVGTPPTKLQAILDRGLQKASSHNQTSGLRENPRHRRHKSRLRTFNITVGVIAILLIIGFVIYRSLPEIDVHLASYQSGVHAEIPSYVPAGFRFQQPVEYGPGTVTLIFASKTSSFQVIQQASSWDSLSLRDSFVNPIDPNYKVIEVGGRIVYLYGGASATWVNGGIWYRVTTSNDQLNTNNLLEIAASL